MGCRGDRGPAPSGAPPGETVAVRRPLPCCPSARPNRCSPPHAAAPAGRARAVVGSCWPAGPGGRADGVARLLGSPPTARSCRRPRPARPDVRPADRRLHVVGRLQRRPWAEPNIGRPQLGADQTTVNVAINTPMPTGPCNVAWSVRQPNGDDGPNGRFGFVVLSSPTPAGGSTASTTPGGSTTPTTVAPADRRRARRCQHGARCVGRVGRRDVARAALSMFGLAVLFGSLVLIVVAWPEGPEYILAVRFLRSVWILTFVGTLLYVVALTAAVNDDSFGTGLSPAAWLDLLDAGWAGRAAIARLVLVIASAWVVLRPERVIDPTTQLPAHRHPDPGRAHDRARAHRWRPGHPRRADGHRPRPRDGGVARRRRAAGPGRARRSRRGGPRPSRARVRPDLDDRHRGHDRERSRPAVPPRRRVAVQLRPMAGCCC